MLVRACACVLPHDQRSHLLRFSFTTHLHQCLYLTSIRLAPVVSVIIIIINIIMLLLLFLFFAFVVVVIEVVVVVSFLF